MRFRKLVPFAVILLAGALSATGLYVFQWQKNPPIDPLTQTPPGFSSPDFGTSSIPVVIGKQKQDAGSIRNASPIDASIDSYSGNIASIPQNQNKKKPVISPEDYLFLESEKPYVPRYFPIAIGSKTIQAEYAYDLRRQIKGLSGRESLAADSGLFYSFTAPGQYHFWMRGMLFPIDIIWLNGDGRVIDIKENVSPDTFPEKFTSREPAQYVLEAAAGFAKRYSVSIGTKADISKFSQAR